MHKYTFHIHRYAPELNKVFLRGVDITKHLPCNLVRNLTRHHKENVRALRAFTRIHLGLCLRLYTVTATRPDGSQEVKQGAITSSKNGLKQFQECLKHYNVVGTKLTLKISWQGYTN